MMRVGKTFNEVQLQTLASAMVLLEGDKPLGAEAHRYYAEIVKRLEQDTKHVQHIQDFWSESTLTAAGSQSHDQEAPTSRSISPATWAASYLSTDVITEAVRKIVNSVPAPPGIKAYVTGAGPLFSAESHAGREKASRKSPWSPFW